MKKKLEAALFAAGICPDGAAFDRLELYARLLLERNKVMNLTAVDNERDIAWRHFFDSAYLLKALPEDAKTLVDVGSGAGFPGLVVKILRPELEVTLLDAQKKRVDFLSDVALALGLDRVSCVQSRAEAISPGMRESFGAACARAVARLNVLCELCMPYVKPGGRFIAIKSQRCGDELDEASRAISLLGGEPPEIVDYTVPELSLPSRLCVIRKTSQTPARFPRSFSRISSDPL